MAEVKLDAAPSGVKTYYDKGIAAMERDNLDYAMDMFCAALSIEPRLLQVRKLLRAAALKKVRASPPGKLAIAKAMSGLIKTKTLQKKDAFQTLEASEKLLCIDPLNGKFAKANCDAAVAADLPEAAVLTLEVLNDNRPPSLAVLDPLARLYRETEQFDLEYKIREQIVKLKPNDTDAVKEMKDAAARLTMGKAGWQKAESFRDVMRQDTAPPSDDLDQAYAKVEAEPNNLNYRRALADMLLLRKRYSEAIQTLETCIELDGGSDPQVERKLMNAKEHLLSYELADAEDADDKERISSLRKQLGDMRMANAALQVVRYPNDLQLKFEYGKLLFDGGLFTEAIQQFQLAQRNPQRRIRSLFYLAESFKAKGQLGVALEQLESGLKELSAMDETRKEFLYELGVVCEKNGDSARAKDCFREIYTVDIGYRDVADKVENGHSS